MKKEQTMVDELIRELGGYWTPFEMMTALVEEVGELADELLKLEGVKGGGNPVRLREEMGDVMFALSCIANHYGIDLGEALGKSIEKYRRRDVKNGT